MAEDTDPPQVGKKENVISDMAVEDNLSSDVIEALYNERQYIPSNDNSDKNASTEISHKTPESDRGFMYWPKKLLMYSGLCVPFIDLLTDIINSGLVFLESTFFTPKNYFTPKSFFTPKKRFLRQFCFEK